MKKKIRQFEKQIESGKVCEREKREIERKEYAKEYKINGRE